MVANSYSLLKKTFNVLHESLTFLNQILYCCNREIVHCINILSNFYHSHFAIFYFYALYLDIFRIINKMILTFFFDTGVYQICVITLIIYFSRSVIMSEVKVQGQNKVTRHSLDWHVLCQE